MKRTKIMIPAMLMMVTLSVMPVYAAEKTNDVVTSSEIQNSTRAIEVEWVYRNYNGVLQKRLWSNTEMCWLTDWIDCE